LKRSIASRRPIGKRGSTRGAASSSSGLAVGKSVRCDAHLIYVTLTDGRVVTMPLTPRLRAATPAQRAKGRVEGWGTALRWEDVDEDIGVADVMGVPEDELFDAAGFKKHP